MSDFCFSTDWRFCRTVRIWLSLGVATFLLPTDALRAQTDIFCDGMKVGTVQFMTAMAGGRPGVTGGFTATILDANGKPSIAAAAAKCDEDHFNWYQTAEGMHPLIPGGGPQPDPLPGGNNPPGDWADDLPWYWDEGPDPAAGTPGFSDGYHVDDNTKDSNGDGVNDTLEYQDFPFGPAGGGGTNVTFNTWLVSLNKDGSFHSFHDGGIQWNYMNKPGAGQSSSIDLSLAFDPTLFQYELLVDPDTTDFTTSIPAVVWDTVINNTNTPINWGPGIWTRDGREIGRTFPGGIVQPGVAPPEVNSDHITLNETPNDFHFDVTIGTVKINVNAVWDTNDMPELFFDFPVFTVPFVNQMQLDFDFITGNATVLDLQDPLLPPLFHGPLDLLSDPQAVILGAQLLDSFKQGPQTHLDLPPQPLPGDFNGDGSVGGDDLNLVLNSWGDPVSDPLWVNQIPLLIGFDNQVPLPVGADQLNLVLNNWGSTSTFEFENVPEPHSRALLTFIPILALFRRRSRHR